MTWLASIGIILGWIVFGLVIALGIVLNFLGLFGNWLILVAISVVAVLSGFEHFGVSTIAILIGLAIVGEVIETLASGIGVAKYGGSKGSMLASVVGCFAGAILGTPLIPIPIVGTVIGAVIGAFLAATAYEYARQHKDLEGSVKVGLGAAMGKVAGIFAKSLVGFIMLGLAYWSY